MMAASFERAFAEIAGPELDRVVYCGRQFTPATENRALADALSGLEPEWQQRLSRQLSYRARCNLHDAEEAIEDEVIYLLEEVPEVFHMERGHWTHLLFWRGRYRLLKNQAAPRLASTNALESALGDVAVTVTDGTICVPISPQAEENAGDGALPRPGDPWGRREVISGLQRFYRYYGRSPRARECRPLNRLPTYGVIRTHFGGLEAALLASGIVHKELGRRRRRWSPVDAARACRSFYRHNGYWPGASDAERNRDQLPSRSVMVRCFGSTHGGEIRGVAESILVAAES
jgi:hypothetical protein